VNPLRKKRLMIVLAILAGVGLTVTLALVALKQNINLFYTPSQIAAGEAPQGAKIRAGGLVKEGSVVRSEQDLSVRFVVTDGVAEVSIRYQGMLPDLFREGQGIVANGTLTSRESFEATEVLAKHDETYMPPEVQDALERAGHPGAAGKNADSGEGKAGASYY